MFSFRRPDLISLGKALRRPALAYCAASCAATLVIVIMGHSTRVFGVQQLAFADIAGMVPYFAVFVGGLGLIPTILAATLLRMARLRRGLAETGGGALIGLFASSAFLLAIGGGGAVLSPTFVAPAAVYGIAGAVAGLTYWLALGCPRNPST